MSEAMKKELQEAFEKALASFEKRQEADISVSASVNSSKPSGPD